MKIFVSKATRKAIARSVRRSEMEEEMRRPKPHVTVPVPEGLAPASVRLVRDFAQVLASKLRTAEEKYGYREGWLTDDWEAECRQHLREHMAKGDPRDVAIYAAFMWQRGWSTAEPARANQ